MRSLLAVVFLGAFLFQLTATPLYALPLPSGGSTGPDFILIAVSFAAMSLRPFRAMLLAALAGVAADVFSLDPPCTHVAAYAAACVVAGSCRRRGLENDALSRAAFLAAASAAAAGAGAGWLWLVGAERVAPGLEAALASVLSSSVIGAIVFAILVPLRKEIERKEAPWFARA